MATVDLFQTRPDQMIDLAYRLVVLAGRLPLGADRSGIGSRLRAQIPKRRSHSKSRLVWDDAGNSDIRQHETDLFVPDAT